MSYFLSKCLFTSCQLHKILQNPVFSRIKANSSLAFQTPNVSKLLWNWCSWFRYNVLTHAVAFP